MIPLIAKGAVDYVKASGSEIPVALHLDHGSNFEMTKKCIDIGFSSVMFDGSHYPFDENIAKTKEIVEYAHLKNVTVEAELGVLAGVEEGKKDIDNYVHQKETELKGETGNVHFAAFKVVKGRLKMYSDPTVDKMCFSRKRSRLKYRLKF